MKTENFQNVTLVVLTSLGLTVLPVGALSETSKVSYYLETSDSGVREEQETEGFGPVAMSDSREDVFLELLPMRIIESNKSAFRVMDPWTGFPPMGTSSNGHGPVPPMASQKGVQYQWRWGN